MLSCAYAVNTAFIINYFEGWGGKCGNNEVTCDFSGYGPSGKITFDWKHFPYEDYDEWLFGETGKWGNDTTIRRPDFLTFQVSVQIYRVDSLGFSSSSL